MTRDELNKALLIERYAPRPRRDYITQVYVQTTPVYDDSDIATARRRRELGEAVKEERKTA